MKAVVTGATGALGRALVRHLLGAGDEIVAASRHETTVEGLRTCAVDFGSTPLRSLVCGANVVFHLAAAVHRPLETAADAAEADAVNHQATAALADACVQEGAKLVFASSVAVLGAGGDGTGDETPPAPQSVYARTKLQGEDAIRTAAGRGLPFAITRLPLLYGPHGRGNMERLLEAIWRGRYWPIGDPGVRKSCLHFDDAAAALVLAAGRAEGTYIVAPPRAAKLSEIHAAAYGALGKRLPRSSLSSSTARLAAAWADSALHVLGRPSRLREQVETLTRPAWYDGSRFAGVTGFAPGIGLEEGLRATAEWIRGRH